MSTRLVYHDPRSSAAISPFDVALVSIARNDNVRLACPYLSATYLERISRLTASWRLLTDVEEWLGAQTRPQRATSFAFIADNQRLIRHIPGLHAKVMIGSRAALIGSANFTDAGITLRTEMAVSLESEAHVVELQGWFDELWAIAHQLPIEEIAVYLKGLPASGALSVPKGPPLFPHRAFTPATLLSLPEDSGGAGAPAPRAEASRAVQGLIRVGGEGSELSNDQGWKAEQMLLRCAWAHGLMPGDTIHRHALFAYIRSHIDARPEGSLSERLQKSPCFEKLESGNYRLTERGYQQAVNLWGTLAPRSPCDCEYVFERQFKAHRVTIRVAPGRVLAGRVVGGRLEYMIDGQETKSTVICDRLRELGASLRPRMHPTQLWDWVVQDRDYSWRRDTGHS